jgi:hypothetical protein
LLTLGQCTINLFGEPIACPINTDYTASIGGGLLRAAGTKEIKRLTIPRQEKNDRDGQRRN